jgi:hypothetical protein
MKSLMLDKQAERTQARIPQSDEMDSEFTMSNTDNVVNRRELYKQNWETEASRHAVNAILM